MTAPAAVSWTSDQRPFRGGDSTRSTIGSAAAAARSTDASHVPRAGGLYATVVSSCPARPAIPATKASSSFLTAVETVARFVVERHARQGMTAQRRQHLRHCREVAARLLADGDGEPRR